MNAGSPGCEGTSEHVRDDDEEQRWLEALAAGDRGEPVRRLYGRWGPEMLALGRRTLGDLPSAEELVQETFVRIWQSAGSFDRTLGSPRTFAFTIAKRTAIDHLRRRSARPRAVAMVSEDLPGRHEDHAHAVAERWAVQEALEALSEKHRTILRLSFYDDLADAEIGRRLGIPVGTVRSRTYYALRALRDELEEHGDV